MNEVKKVNKPPKLYGVCEAGMNLSIPFYRTTSDVEADYCHGFAAGEQAVQHGEALYPDDSMAFLERQSDAYRQGFRSGFRSGFEHKADKYHQRVLAHLKLG